MQIRERVHQPWFYPEDSMSPVMADVHEFLQSGHCSPVLHALVAPLLLSENNTVVLAPRVYNAFKLDTATRVALEQVVHLGGRRARWARRQLRKGWLA